MSLPLLSTKFNVPAPGAHTVSRPCLLRMLDESLEHKAALVLVCGPAGYGKTTIVSEWLQTSPLIQAGQYAWLTLEPGDDDLTRFLTYFITALQRIHPGLGEGVLKTLKTHKTQPIMVLATLIINELNEIPGPFCLILDDYHLLTDESIQGFMTFLVEHQPPHLCLVLITRSDPPLPLARLRAKGKLVELRQKELCFSHTEAGDFLSQKMGISLSPEQISFLNRQTEGWITGLQLAAISLRDVQDRSAFFTAFSGEHEFIADYLTNEVLARLPEAVRLFLLQTSILERLSAPLCEAVTGQTGAQAILEQLVETNLFSVPLDSQHSWFRYHTLFGDLLRKRLASSPGGKANTLHERASLWFEAHDQADLAIEHAIAAENYGRAARLIEGVAERLLSQGEAATLLRWQVALPEAQIVSRPLLGALHGITLILSGRPIQRVAALLEKMQASGSLEQFQGEQSMLQAFVTVFRGDAAGTIRLSKQALQHLSPERPFFHSLAADTLGMGHTLAGDIPAASRAFEQVVEISRQSGNVMMEMMSLTNLSGLHYVQGWLRTAINDCQQVLDLARRTFGSQTPLIGKTLFNLGEMLREQGDLDGALKCLLEAARMMERFSEVGLPLAFLGIARVHLNKKDWPAVQTYIDKARQQTQASQSVLINERLVDLMRVRAWLARGELNPAQQWAQRRGFYARAHTEFFDEADRNASLNELFLAEYLTLIRLTLAQKQTEPALGMIALLQAYVEKKKYTRRVVEILILKALALQQKGENDQALLTLGEALAISEPEGYQRIFVDEGEPMARLLYQAVAREISPTYTGRLLAVLVEESRAVTPLTPTQAGELLEPLSQRELEVLTLIAEGLSNRAIAGRLVISLSTVKGHTSNIFSKLGVQNRTQAVALARSLGLLA